MKFDEYVFNLSAEAYNNAKSPNNDKNEEIKKKQDKLLKLLLMKFQEQLKSQKNLDKGILKAKFENKFWSDFNDGYQEIDELVKSDNFDSFASDYCMYIGEVEDRCNEYYNAYYEIIWDYKTYFEEFKSHQPAKKTVNNKRKEAREAKKAFCKEFGHNFSEWKEVKWTTIEEDGPVGIEALFTGVGYTKVEHTKWTRHCKKCGTTQSSSKKPAEVEAKEIEEQIKILQKKLETKK